MCRIACHKKCEVKVRVKPFCVNVLIFLIAAKDIKQEDSHIDSADFLTVLCIILCVWCFPYGKHERGSLTIWGWELIRNKYNALGGVSYSSVCVCVCVCMYVYVRACVCACARVCVCVHTDRGRWSLWSLCCAKKSEECLNKCSLSQNVFILDKLLRLGDGPVSKNKRSLDGATTWFILFWKVKEHVEENGRENRWRFCALCVCAKEQLWEV